MGEVRSAMWAKMSGFLGSAGNSFLGEPTNVSGDAIRDTLFQTQQMRNPAARVNVIEQEPAAAGGHTYAQAQALYANARSNLLKMRTGSSFLQGPGQINIAEERSAAVGGRAGGRLAELAEASSSASAAI